MGEGGVGRDGVKTAIVTAAGSGMGAACARELASRGYAVALMSPSGKAEDLAKELGGIGLTGSVTEVADLEALVGETLDRHGRIDGVVNSTGHPPSGEILDLTDEQWHETLDLVVLNVVRMARLVTPVMLRQGGGAIVNVSTFSAFEPSPHLPPLLLPARRPCRLHEALRRPLRGRRRQDEQRPAGLHRELRDRRTDPRVDTAAEAGYGCGDREDGGVPALRRLRLHHGAEHPRG